MAQLRRRLQRLDYRFKGGVLVSIGIERHRFDLRHHRRKVGIVRQA